MLKILGSDMKIFPIEIYKCEYPDNINLVNNTLQEYIDFDNVKQKNQGSMRGNGVCSYVARRDLQNEKKLQSVVKFITDNCKEYWKVLKFDSKYKPIITEMWFNVYKKNSYIDTHNHAPVTTTCSFYIKKNPRDANIIFENPLSTLLKHQPYYIDRDNYHTLFEHEVVAQTGDLIMFPGWMNHKTIPSTIDEDRIMIGANICTGV